MSDAGALRALEHAVLTASFVPEGVPERVAAAAVYAALPAGSPSRREFAQWGSEPSTTSAAVDAGRLAAESYAGSPTPAVVSVVTDLYGWKGVIGCVGIGAAARMSDRVRQAPVHLDGPKVPEPPVNDESRPTLIRIRRSFDSVPPPWTIMAWQPRLLSRWWAYHEEVMAPSQLTGEEKRLALIVSSAALGLDELAAAYRDLLTNWTEEEIKGMAHTESIRLRKGVRTAITSLGAYAVGALESARFELAAKAMPVRRANEFRSIVDLATGLAAFARLS